MHNMLKLLNEFITRYTTDITLIDDFFKNKFKLTFNGLTDVEKKEFIDYIKELSEGDIKSYELLMSFILSVTADEHIVTALSNMLLYEDVDLFNMMFVNSQLSIYRFLKNIATPKVYADSIEIQKKIIYEHKKRIQEQFFKYIPVSDRNIDKILLMIDPILGERHAPTIRLVNLYYYLEKIGYDVNFVATNYNLFEQVVSEEWWQAKLSNFILDKTVIIESEWLGCKMRGAHISYTYDNYFKEVEMGLTIVRNYNPLFIWEIGGNNILADLCAEFTSVISMTCTSSVPVTLSKYVMNYFNVSNEDKELRKQFLSEDIQIFDVIHETELVLKEEDITRAELGLDEESFLISIMGNRLDSEITDEFMELILDIASAYQNVVYVILGECPKFQNCVENNVMSERFVFLGNVENYVGVLGICNLVLNPPRRGGGSIIMSMKNSVPVLTLPDCDVARSAGEEFVCESLEAMKACAGRYIEDREYMESQRRKAKKAYEEEHKGIDNISVIKEFCDEFKRIIMENEV